MLDLQFIRENASSVKQAIVNKAAGDTDTVDSVLELDKSWRSLTTRIQDTQTRANTTAREIGELMRLKFDSTNVPARACTSESSTSVYTNSW